MNSPLARLGSASEAASAGLLAPEHRPDVPAPDAKPLSFPREFEGLQSPAWLYAFFAVEIGLQLLIITPWGERARILVRTGGFVASFALLFVLRGSPVSHPARKMAIAALVVVGLSILHPDTNGIWAGCATVLLHLAVLAPIFWVPRLRIDVETVRRVFFMFWAFNTASAVFGALQVYFPGQFQPTISSLMDDGYVRALTVTLANGDEVIRPMGLTTQPGGAAVGAMYSVVLGVAVLLNRPPPWARIVILAGMALALFTLCLSMVRAFVVVTIVSFIALIAPLAAQRRVGRLVGLVASISVIAVVGFLLAASVGGESVTTRLNSLIESDPATVYFDNRGMFLKHTFMTLLSEFPAGAGLGRWGVVSVYFGDRFGHVPPLWAEIQWTGWLYDGGILLIIIYAIALLIALRVAYRIATTGTTPEERELQKWATAVFGYGVGSLALTFSAVPFHSPQGIEFWVLNATLFAASYQARALSRAQHQF
jgi:hypothetical protein